MEGELEWLVHSILGASLEDLFKMWRKKRFDPIFWLCKMCDVIVSQILLIFEGRWAGMARPQHHRGYLGGFIYNMMEERFWLAVLKDLFTMWRKKCFNPIFGLFKLCNVIISQILSILDKRWAGMARPQHLRGSLGCYINNMRKNVLTLFWDLAWCVMLLFLGFYQFLMKVMLEWLIHSILGALLYNMKKKMFSLQF